LIFVTVGGMHAFDRLVIAVDNLAGELDEEVVMQVGPTGYEPTNCEYFKFMAANEMQKLYARARVVICHAGIGSILTAWQYDKPLILVPRMKRYGEHMDDHQLEIAEEMERRGMTVVYDISNLKSAMLNVDTNAVRFGTGGDLSAALKQYLDRLESQLTRE
jgi:beta-1,4-N-acetylglucosaminyltransferase